MKILILANDAGGLYHFRKELIFELLKENEVIVSVPDEYYREEYIKLGCRIVIIPFDRRGINPLKDIGLFRQYSILLKTEKPDLVITYTIKPNVYGGMACRMAGVQYAVNVAGLGTAFQGNGALRRLVTRMYRAGCRKAKVVFFENSENRQVFIDEKIVPENRTCLLDGAGVNLEHYQLTDYPQHDEGTRFLFIGRVMKEKGIDELLEAFRRLVSENVRCSLDVVGFYEEDYREELERCEAEGWLRFHGRQSDVRPFIADCHCFVLPSWHEGMANTNLECAACGRPVITSNIHGCLEAVEDGVSGFLCEKQNAEDLYRIMKKFCLLPNETRKEMGLAGRKRMEEIFDKKKVVEDTLIELLKS